MTLELNENRHVTPVSMSSLEGKRLAYVEANPAAAKATMEILQATPLEVTHRTSLAALPDNYYDMMLCSIPVKPEQTLADYDDRLKRVLSMTRHLLLALPSQFQVEAEELKRRGVQACLIKPMSSIRLLPLLLKEQQPAVRILGSDETKAARLPLTAMAVDDNPANLKLIGALLEELVETTVLCHSGEEAIEVARHTDLDIILMDIQMPDIDGIRASEIIHQMARHARTPVVAVTAHSLSGEREQLLKLGMDDYLAKPIDEGMLKNVLSRHYSHQNQQDSPLQTQEDLAPNNTLDWQLALSQSANKVALAQDLLQMLVEFLPQVAVRVDAVARGETDDDILALIHKLHGSCSYSGVPRLKQLCYYIEQQLRQGVGVETLEPEWFELLDEIENVKRAAVAYLPR